MTFASYADMQWVGAGDHACVFIGDAGRGLSPQLGQGANLALIDAATPPTASRQTTSIEAALGLYTTARRRHGRFYALASRWLTPFFQSDSRWAARLRDVAFPLMGQVPYLRHQMARTLSGMKTGLFTHVDPGIWHPDYALRRPQRRRPPKRPAMRRCKLKLAGPQSGATVELGHDELAMARALRQRSGGRWPCGSTMSISASPAVSKRQLAPQDAGHVEVDVLCHRAHRLGIAADLDHRHDRVADDVALPGREGVHDVAAGGHQRHALGGRRGCVHVVEARALRRVLRRAPARRCNRHLRPIFSRLPSAFSSMVVRPPAMLPLVGWLSDRSSTLCGLDHLVLIGLEGLHPLVADLRR